jgi:hypothetical protein
VPDSKNQKCFALKPKSGHKIKKVRGEDFRKKNKEENKKTFS